MGVHLIENRLHNDDFFIDDDNNIKVFGISEKFLLKAISDTLAWTAPSLLFSTNGAELDFNLGNPADAPHESGTVDGTYNRVHLFNAGGFLTNTEHKSININLPSGISFLEGITTFKLKPFDEVYITAIKNLAGNSIWAIKTPLLMKAYGKKSGTNYTTDTTSGVTLEFDYNDSTELFLLTDSNRRIRVLKTGTYTINASITCSWVGTNSPGNYYGPNFKLRHVGDATTLYDSAGSKIEKIAGESIPLHINNFTVALNANDELLFNIEDITGGGRAAGVRVSIETVL